MNLGMILYYGFSYFFKIIDIFILVRVVLSWLPLNQDSALIHIVYRLTEPILGPIRKLLERSVLGGKGLMIDFSPLIAWLILDFIESSLLYFIRMYL